jgi:hypothetical protein
MEVHYADCKYGKERMVTESISSFLYDQILYEKSTT